MITFDSNLYPVDPEYVGRSLILRATHATVCIMNEKDTLHKYPRLWERNEIFLAPDHQEKIARSRNIKEHRMARSSLENTLTCGRELVLRWAELDESLQNSAKRVLNLVAQYGKESVEAAARLAIDNGTPRACSIAQILAECASAPDAPVHMKTAEDLPELKIEWPSVSSYDDLY
jgi:hypothetical protein